jgi:hypothetical protein
MPTAATRMAIALTAALGFAGTAAGQELCQGFGPQTPRDISSAAGTNARVFTLAPPASQMNLCNIHTHTNAEHKGPGLCLPAMASMAATSATTPIS